MCWIDRAILVSMQPCAIAGESNQVHHSLHIGAASTLLHSRGSAPRCILGSEAPLSRISSAFSSFFGILFGDGLPDEVANEFGYEKKPEEKPAPGSKARPRGPHQ